MTEFVINEQSILDGLDKDEFVYYYQPKVSLITGKVIGAEALIRWLKPDGSVIQPDSFIPQAEQSGQIRDITYRMFSKLARDLLIFSDIDSELVTSFNATAQDFADDRFSKMVLETVEQLHIPPKNLQIEITETTVLNASPSVKKHIQSLCEAGIGLAMDDYGTGYATLETLSHWPFTTIKLDRSIVNRMLDTPKNQTIAETSIRMAHELDIGIVAEGVESDLQYQMLLESGCTKVQGYWLSRPLPLSDFIYFIEQDLRWSGLPIGLIHMAIVDHIQWRKRLVSDIVRIAANPHHTLDRNAYQLPLDYHDCRLGKWYYGAGQHFRGCADFDAIELPHQKFHSLGGQLIEIVNSGGSMADLTPTLTAFSDQSAIILDCLQKLEHRGLMDMHAAHHAWEEHHLYPGL
ncbi:EAL domain-containing protein [Methylomonas rosea]|uniref:EAL domain-containing protein n=1 Tax=Methylomonas rosea TaxID=2952227 RepID=A0ABT1TT55_9GAMM|nr:EAL domain-containing protein [Methylomonas sp. WSC-7]MCQ8117939.1 EAL domain-containing protein [Methylomonas sp. WSC-7]